MVKLHNLSIFILIFVVISFGKTQGQQPQNLDNISPGMNEFLQEYEKDDNSSRHSHQRHFIDTVDDRSKENTVRLLDYFRRRNGDGECNPETNIYPCGALDFLGCTGNKKYYAESVIRLNWFEAWEFCRNNDMHLASIESTYEQVFLELFLPKPESGSKEGFWLSGTDLGREGLFYWMANGKSFTYTNWKSSEPNNFKKREHCVQMSTNLRSSTDSLKWNDVTCNSVGYVICQEPYNRKNNEPTVAFDFVQERDNSHKLKSVDMYSSSSSNNNNNDNDNNIVENTNSNNRKPAILINHNIIHADEPGEANNSGDGSSSSSNPSSNAAAAATALKYQQQFIQLQPRPQILSFLANANNN